MFLRYRKGNEGGAVRYKRLIFQHQLLSPGSDGQDEDAYAKWFLKSSEKVRNDLNCFLQLSCFYLYMRRNISKLTTRSLIRFSEVENDLMMKI